MSRMEVCAADSSHTNFSWIRLALMASVREAASEERAFRVNALGVSCRGPDDEVLLGTAMDYVDGPGAATRDVERRGRDLSPSNVTSRYLLIPRPLQNCTAMELWVAIGTGVLALATFVLAGISAWNV